MPQSITPQAMTESEARSITDRINEKSNELWPLLKEANERKAWAALGYASWREYAGAEFSLSHSRAYQLLDQAKVITSLRAAANSTDVEITEAVARDIKPNLEKVTAEIKEKVQAGADPIKTTYAVIEATRVESAAKKDAAKPPKPQPSPPDRTAELEAKVEALSAELAETRENATELAHMVEATTFTEQGSEVAAKEIARLLAMLETVKSQRDGHMTTCAEMQRTIKSKNRIIEKLERELAKATSK